MTIHLNRQVRPLEGETRRPSFPMEQQSGNLFLGWGPKI
jgi:hypothetical protein